VSKIEVRPLPPLNENYSPPQPWRCATRAEHDCTGSVIGAVGAYPVCANGAEAEIEARLAEEARRAELLADPEIQRQIAWEQRVERRLS
jgi:hypothetical protein